MRSAIVAVLLLLPLFALAEDRDEKRALLAEFLDAIDAKELARSSLTASLVCLDTNAFDQRLLQHIDFARFADEVYAPLFDARLAAGEMRELVAFFRTSPGRKFLAVLPQLGALDDPGGLEILREAVIAAEEAREREEAARSPWLATMDDMRTIAAALESRATDEETYPNVRFSELEALLTPTYLRHLPAADAWGTPFSYAGNGQSYRIVSAGADRRFEWHSERLDPDDVAPRLSEDLDADIIFQDGGFLQAPREATTPPASTPAPAPPPSPR